MLDRVDTTAETSSPSHSAAVPLRDFLARVGAVLSAGLPGEVWVEATVLAVRTGAYGHSLELVDPAPAHGSAPQLSVFLPKTTLTDIRQQLGLPLDPVLLAGMSVVVLIAPRFDPRWHLGGRVLRIAGGVTESIRRKMIEETVAKLRRESLFDAQGRLRTPADITRIAVVHPAHAAGWDDIRWELARWTAAGLIVLRSIPASFEGDGATDGIAKAIVTASEPIAGSPPDLVLLVRGGGGRAGLLALDTETVARAICRCPVPVITGLGHAGDTALADRVAWLRADTPSKALAAIAEIIGTAARRTEENRATIARLAVQAAAAAEQQLMLLRGAVDRTAETAWAKAGSDLEARWTALRVLATAAQGSLGRKAEQLRTILDEQGRAARAVLDRAEGALQRARSELLDQVWRGLSRTDDGTAALAGLETLVRARLERAAAQADQAFDAVRDRVARQIEMADTALKQIALVLEAHDLAGTLRRGFALVLDPMGRVVPDRTTAARQRRLTLQFHDGVIEAKPVGDV